MDYRINSQHYCIFFNQKRDDLFYHLVYTYLANLIVIPPTIRIVRFALYLVSKQVLQNYTTG